MPNELLIFITIILLFIINFKFIFEPLSMLLESYPVRFTLRFISLYIVLISTRIFILNNATNLINAICVVFI